MTNLQLLNALVYVVEHGCKWRGLPRHFGNWHTIYTRMSRWSKAAVLDRVFARLQQEQILAIRIEHLCLDSTTIKVHPGGGCYEIQNGKMRKLGEFEYFQKSQIRLRRGPVASGGASVGATDRPVLNS